MKSEELERQAVALVKQYGWVLPPPVRKFFRELADHLQWETLKGTLK